MSLVLVTVIVFWSIWALAEKKALQYGTPWQTLFVSGVIKTIVVLPILWILLYQKNGDSGVFVHSNVWLWMLIAMVVNGIAIVLLRFVLQKGGAGVTIALVETSPIVATILAFFFLGEIISFTQGLGILITLTGVVFLSKG